MTETVNFAKPAFDVGLFSNDIEPLIEFYRDELGLAYDELLKVGGGVHQHRLSWGHSILKLNAIREALGDEAPGPIAELRILQPGREQEQVVFDPQGNAVRLCPAATPALGATLIGRDAESTAHDYATVLKLSRLSDRLLACGDSQLALQEGQPRAVGQMRARGWRYLTFQITDVAGTHQHALDSGLVELEPPKTLGSVASISFVRDRFGTPIELSQRASLTGDLTIQQRPH